MRKLKKLAQQCWPSVDTNTAQLATSAPRHLAGASCHIEHTHVSLALTHHTWLPGCASFAKPHQTEDGTRKQGMPLNAIRYSAVLPWLPTAGVIVSCSLLTSSNNLLRWYTKHYNLSSPFPPYPLVIGRGPPPGGKKQLSPAGQRMNGFVPQTAGSCGSLSIGWGVQAPFFNL